MKVMEIFVMATLATNNFLPCSSSKHNDRGHVTGLVSVAFIAYNLRYLPDIK